MPLKAGILAATAEELGELLKTKRLTSVELVELCLAQIEKHNHAGMKLNAVLLTAPKVELLEVASALDQERFTTGPRGPLHGIPVLLKDTICTPSLNMETTLGSYALKGAIAKSDAALISNITSAGLIVIGKANLNELGGSKGFPITGGWSALGGQTQSPYVRGGVLPNATFLGHSTPCGSASGNAVGVAAGFAPLSIANEADGSLVQPATRAALYALKITVGVADLRGVFAGPQGGPSAFNSIGAQTKSVWDLAQVIGVLMGKSFPLTSNPSPWKGIRVGFVDYDLWQPLAFVVEPNEEFKLQTYAAMDSAKARIESRGGTVIQPVPMPTLADITCDPKGVSDIGQLMGYESRPSLEQFLALFDAPSGVKTIDDLINSIMNTKISNYRLNGLESAKNNNMTKEFYNNGLKLLREAATTQIDKVLVDNEIDVIMGPADARMASVGAAAGYPVAVVPLGFAEFNGRAFGMCLIGKAHSEAKILEVMKAWESVIPEGRASPPQLINWDYGI